MARKGREREERRGRKGKTEENKLLCSGPASINASTCLLAQKNHTQLAAESEMVVCPNIHKRKRQRSRKQKILAADMYAKTGFVCRNSKSAWP